MSLLRSILGELFGFTLEGNCWTDAQRDLDALGPYLSASSSFFRRAFAKLTGTKGPLCASISF